MGAGYLATPLIADPKWADGELFSNLDGREVLVPYEWAASDARRAASDDARAAGLALHAVADVLFASAPGARREEIERKAVRLVRRQLFTWHLTSPEIFVRLGIARGRRFAAYRAQWHTFPRPRARRARAWRPQRRRSARSVRVRAPARPEPERQSPRRDAACGRGRSATAQVGASTAPTASGSAEVAARRDAAERRSSRPGRTVRLRFVSVGVRSWSVATG